MRCCTRIETSIQVKDFPDNNIDNMNTHEITFSNKIYIENNDFRMQDSPKYFRLAPHKIVRLKYVGLIKCVNVINNNNNNNNMQIDVELLNNDYKPEKRVRGTFGWINAKDYSNITIRQYENNLISPKIIHGVANTCIKLSKPYDHFQFERIGYFIVDPDITDTNIILNMTVGLKEDKNK